jgi:hypothetical protein
MQVIAVEVEFVMGIGHNNNDTAAKPECGVEWMRWE